MLFGSVLSQLVTTRACDIRALNVGVGYEQGNLFGRELAMQCERSMVDTCLTDVLEGRWVRRLFEQIDCQLVATHSRPGNVFTGCSYT